MAKEKEEETELVSKPPSKLLKSAVFALKSGKKLEELEVKTVVKHIHGTAAAAAEPTKEVITAAPVRQKTAWKVVDKSVKKKKFKRTSKMVRAEHKIKSNSRFNPKRLAQVSYDI